MRKVIAAALAMPLLVSGVATAQTGNAGSGAMGPFTVDIEALAWWFKSSPTPTPIITDGVYGQPNTNVLLGGGDMETNPNPGFRLSAGPWPRWPRSCLPTLLPPQSANQCPRSA